ncbi:MAG TPA: lysine--tRNA ligase [Candidatus Dormibacteraeota bacterium]|nr:lysine--tRNA ligase [Candidatus Dormibacteraeota bacterium]
MDGGNGGETRQPGAAGGAELRQARLTKLKALLQRGVEPFAVRFDRSHTTHQAIGLYEEAERGTAGGRGGDPETVEEVRTTAVSVAGRVTRHRSQGRVAFADIVDAGGKLQLYARADNLGEADMALFNDLDLGDIVGAQGELFRTRRGEISLDVRHLTLLTKALRPLPDKWHGLKDPELRFRQRHVDLIANREAGQILKLRSRLISHFRHFLDERGFEEVETPVLHRIAGGAAARPFSTHHNALDMELSLRIALELHLKRLVIGGMENIYEIGRVFRNEGIDAHHNPEFTMLELYQAYSDLGGIMELTEELIKSTAEALGKSAGLEYQGHAINISGDWERRELLDLVRERNPGLDLDSKEALQARAGELGAIPRERDWGELVYEVFERSVEHTLRQPTFVTGHPLSVSPLARRRLDDERLADRFELFIAGQEIGNAFSELTDPIDQRARFEQQLAVRQLGDDAAHPMDVDFIAALEQGMPPTGGLGIGIDRLTMLFTDVAHIREVIAFPLMRDAPSDDAVPEDRGAEPARP